MRPQIVLALSLTLFAVPAAGFSEVGFIAGSQPSQRPASAPVITTQEKDAQWFANALKGVEKPYPDSLRFLDDQGAWFNPFLRPGMTGPYDIRGHH